MTTRVRSTGGELLEREDHLAQLAAQIDAARAGTGAVVAIEGEAGIGKSALLGWAVRQGSGAGMRVLSASGGELEQGFGYGVVRQLFGAPLAAIGPKERARVMDGAAAAAAAALSGFENAASASDQGSVLYGLYWLTANLAERQPLLVAVDDAHWADAASIMCLVHLARRVEGMRVLLVYTTRMGEAASEQLPGSRDPGLATVVLQPRPLSERATALMVAHALDDRGCESFARACRLATGGNPFLLTELLRVLRADGIVPTAENCEPVSQLVPDAVARAVVDRLRRLGSGPARLASATAVLGSSAPLRHAAALARLDPDGAVAAADSLTAAGILHDGRPLQFIHPIVRGAVYRDIPASRRAVLHKRAAACLQRDGLRAADVAPHLLASEPSDDANVVERLRVAAGEVRHRGAPDAACAYLERALAEPPAPALQSTVTYELGSAELAAGRPSAITHLQRALEGDLDLATQAAVRVDISSALVTSGRIQESVGVLDAAISALAAGGQADAAMELEGVLLGVALLHPATCRLVATRLVRHADPPPGASLGEQALLAAMAFDAAHRPVSAAYAAELAERALTDAAALLERYPYGPSFQLAAGTLGYADRLERVDELLTLAVERAQVQGSLQAYTFAIVPRCLGRIRQGRLADAEADARSCLEALVGQPWSFGRPMLLACVLDAMVERTELSACHAFLDEQGISDDAISNAMSSRLLYSRGHLRLASGDAAGALRDFDAVRSQDRAAGQTTAAVQALGSAALALAQLGDRARATDLAEQELQRARTWNTPSAMSFALQAAGTVRGGPEGIALLREATEVLEHTPPRYQRARALTAYGAALRRAGQRSAAREPLRDALELADRFGARRTAARARDELLATGARPRRAQRTGADALTASERRVALLAAAGHSNRQIAESLFVTVRTVETHLSHTYDKLGVRARQELAGALDGTIGGPHAH